MKEINPELVIYRLDKMEALMNEHNRIHEKNMAEIIDRLGGQYTKSEIDEKHLEIEAKLQGKASKLAEVLIYGMCGIVLSGFVAWLVLGAFPGRAEALIAFLR